MSSEFESKPRMHANRRQLTLMVSFSDPYCASIRGDWRKFAVNSEC